MSSSAIEAPHVHEVTPAEGWEIFDRAARRIMGMSGRAFLDKWDRGEFQNTDDTDVFSLEILLPFAR